MKLPITLSSLAAVASSLFLPALPELRAAQFDVTGATYDGAFSPAYSGAFGTTVTVLPNGNFVVTDPFYDVPGIEDIGAVYLYDGVTLAILSVLTGSTANDRVGNGDVTVLTNGSYVVTSISWNGQRGAATWGSGTTGVNGAVSAVNSLVGSTAGDGVGNNGVIALTNGNYVVRSPSWDDPAGPVANVGAVTWGNGTTGVSGVISAANSLIGSTASDNVGLGTGAVLALSNGSYVVRSTSWDNPAGPVANVGAVTWGSGTTGVSGAISAANSLIGGTTGDGVGFVTALSNGNYVVNSSSWDNPTGPVADVGAVTWVNGTTGATGVISAANSLIGGTAGDGVGSVTALTNGNYVVTSSSWDNPAGPVVNAGAVTWGNGTTGTTGVVSVANSVVGGRANDSVGGNGVTTLTNGNYVVRSASWDNPAGPVANVGAATWGNGTTGTIGVVSVANSLVGGTANETVGSLGVTALTNGNYVVTSPNWTNPVGPVANVGAVVWGNGTTGVSGIISAAISLIGSSAGDSIGSTGIITGNVVALSNGNYVVRSPSWDNPVGPVANVGAVTWGNGANGTIGVVSAANSLVGSSADDQVGSLSPTSNNVGVLALSNGNYVVCSPNWDNPAGPVANVGAVTWGNGTTGVSGVVSASNSLVGSAANDQAGSPLSTSIPGVIALSNGNYVVRSETWNGARGAVTWGNGTTGVSGAISAANSLVGSFVGDSIGLDGVTALNNGSYVVGSRLWNGERGAVTLGDGMVGTSGVVTAANSVRGTVLGGGGSTNFTYDDLHTRLLVGYPTGNRVSLFDDLPPPEIAVQQPPNISLADGATRIFGAPVGANASLIFTIKNTSLGTLTGLGITIDGSDAALFTVTTSPTAPVTGPLGSTTFTVRFAPTSPGIKTAALHLASNDPDENPFTINLSGRTLVFTQDTDGDGMSDASEFHMAALGFDWQVSQPALVNAYNASANGAGYYTAAQIQALNVGVPLLTKNPATGQFKLTIGVQKTSDPGLPFLGFPLNGPGASTLINGDGELEFLFTVPDNAAFFRLESQ